jgi:hypothetical protein
MLLPIRARLQNTISTTHIRGEDGWLAAQFIMFAFLMIAEASLWPTAFNGALFFISAYVCFLIADRDDASTPSEAA